ncbi:hypothetical protein ACFYVL_17115 [Streptomyces sp. NPDC004111]|uniref:hypothetical protein n=1 Tax=Streptomyces sp. NPDC004111 TaxID=3364690 RepID=UPI00367F676C
MLTEVNRPVAELDVDAHQTEYLRHLVRQFQELVARQDTPIGPPVDQWWGLIQTVAGSAGDAVLDWLDRHQPGGCGPVLCSGDSTSLLWLVPPGAAARWSHAGGIAHPEGGTAHVPSHTVVAPPGLHWKRVPKREDFHFVGARMLASALDAVAAPPPLRRPAWEVLT